VKRGIAIARHILRSALSWKFAFYELLMPVLRGLGASAGDMVLGWIGWLAISVRPRTRRLLRSSLEHALFAVDADWSVDEIWPALAANTARFLARDYALDGLSDELVLSRFAVRGYERLDTALRDGRGAILVGSHLGAHIAGLHWLVRRGVPLRFLFQRPRHISRTLDRYFDVDGAHPQAAMFLRRDLSRAVAVERIFRARAALRDGLAIYLNGDIPWAGPNTCAGSLLGHPQHLLAIWTELAVLTGASVFLIFCTHQSGGRFALEIESIGRLLPGEEQAAVADYLKQLEARIVANPAAAVAHLLWPCYRSPVPAASSGATPRRRRNSLIHGLRQS
jgi:lauroyl/myristoyl acyltransferase